MGLGIRCEDCGQESLYTPPGYPEPLCYGCLYRRYEAFKAEHAKDFKRLCETEVRLALALGSRNPTDVNPPRPDSPRRDIP